MPKPEHRIPFELRNNKDWLFKVMTALHQYSAVSLNYELLKYSDDGSPEGEWIVTIDSADNKKAFETFTSTSASLEEALYDAFTRAELHQDGQVDAKAEARKAALAKLTKEDRQALGLA